MRVAADGWTFFCLLQCMIKTRGWTRIHRTCLASQAALFNPDWFVGAKLLTSKICLQHSLRTFVHDTHFLTDFFLTLNATLCLIDLIVFSLSIFFSVLCVTSDAWRAVHHAVGPDLCAPHARGACPCWRLRPHSSHEVHATHDERTCRPSFQRGQGTLCWWVVPWRSPSW